jgi:hypothetical protein
MTNSRVVKVVVVSFSLLLAGGYLVWSNRDSLMTSSKRAHVSVDEEVFALPIGTPEKDPSPSTQPRTIAFSSKSNAPMGDTRFMASSSKFAAVSPPSTQPRTMIPSAWKSAPVTILPDSPPRTMASSSKSFIVTAPTTQPRRMIYGSKSGRIFESESVLYADGDVVFANPATQPSTQPATQPATSPATRRVFMGGSKSKAVDVLPQQQR